MASIGGIVRDSILSTEMIQFDLQLIFTEKY